MSYVRTEDLETADFFFPVVSAIIPTKADFYPPIPKIGIMAKPHLVNLIAEKSGVIDIHTDTGKRGKYVWVSLCSGRKRMPDGTWRSADTSYEWDAELRAKMDFLNQPDKYKTEEQKEYHILEYAKCGESRCATGAQHALIHKLAHVARSFANEQELLQGMLVSRIDRNNAAIIAATQDPQVKLAILNQAAGATEAIFGPPSKQIEAQPESAPERKLTEEEIQNGEVAGQAPVEEGQTILDFPGAEPKKTEDELQAEKILELREKLGKLLEDKAIPIKSAADGQKWLRDHADAKKILNLESCITWAENLIADSAKRAKKGGAA